MAAQADRTAPMANGRRRFRPGIGSTVATLVGIAVLIALGTWQLHRLAWKEELIATARARTAAPPIELPPDPADWPALDFRHVSATGRYLDDKSLAFGFSGYAGRPGADLVTPLALDDGRTILVDRGWVPTEMRPPASPKAPAGTVRVTGTLRYRGEPARNIFQPADDPGGRRWFGWDVRGMAAYAGRPLLPVVVTADPVPGAPEFPRAQPVDIDFPNNHLGYVITWYGLAAALAGVYVAFSLTKPDGPAP